MNILFADPLLIVVSIIGVISLVLVFLLIEYYKKLKDNQFVNEVISVSDKSEKKDTTIKTSPEKQINDEKQTEQKIDINKTSPITTNSDIVLAQINELSNQINSINDNLKELYATVKNLSTTISEQSSKTNEKYVEKLLTALQHIETIISSQPKSNSAVDNETLAEINAKLDNILKILSAILQQ